MKQLIIRPYNHIPLLHPRQQHILGFQHTLLDRPQPVAYRSHVIDYSRFFVRTGAEKGAAHADAVDHEGALVGDGVEPDHWVAFYVFFVVRGEVREGFLFALTNDPEAVGVAFAVAHPLVGVRGVFDPGVICEVLLFWGHHVVGLYVAYEGGETGFCFQGLAATVVPVDGQSGSCGPLDAPECCEPGWIAGVEGCVNVPALETGMTGFVFFVCGSVIVPCVKNPFLECDVSKSIVVFSLIALPNETDIFCTGYTQDVSPFLNPGLEKRCI